MVIKVDCLFTCITSQQGRAVVFANTIPHKMTPLMHASTFGNGGTLLGSAYHDSEKEWRLKVRGKEKEIGTSTIEQKV